MLRTLVLKVAVGVAATVVAVPVVSDLAEPDPPARTEQAPAREQADRGRAGHRPAAHGRVGFGFGEDGIRFRMEGHDAGGGSGSAGVSLTDEGFELDMDSDGPDGRGSARVSMTDVGFGLRFDVDESR